MANFVKENRVGRFEVHNEMITEQPGVIMLALCRCLVIRAEALMHTGTVEYYAYSADFDEVPHDSRIPTYRPIFERIHDAQDMSRFTVKLIGFEKQE